MNEPKEIIKDKVWFNFTNQWVYVFNYSEVNWFIFELFNFSVDYEKMLGSIKIRLTIIGFDFEVVIGVNNKESKIFSDKLEAILNDMQLSGWVSATILEGFKNKEINTVRVARTRSIARQNGLSNPIKIYIEKE